MGLHGRGRPGWRWENRLRRLRVEMQEPYPGLFCPHTQGPIDFGVSTCGSLDSGHLHSFHRLFLFLHNSTDPFVPASRSRAVRRRVTGNKCIITSRHSPFFSGGGGGGGRAAVCWARNNCLGIPSTTILPACNVDVPRAFFVLHIPCQDRRRQNLTSFFKRLSPSMYV